MEGKEEAKQDDLYYDIIYLADRDPKFQEYFGDLLTASQLNFSVSNELFVRPMAMTMVNSNKFEKELPNVAEYIQDLITESGGDFRFRGLQL